MCRYFTAIFSIRYTLDADLSCTTIGTLSPPTSPSSSSGDSGAVPLPLIGKSDDIESDQLGMNLMEVVHSAPDPAPDGGGGVASSELPFVHFHFAGCIFTVAGMNSAGLAIGMTGTYLLRQKVVTIDRSD